MNRTECPKIRAVQRLNDGAIVSLEKGQWFCETEKSYEIWGANNTYLPRRIMSIRKTNIGFVFEKQGGKMETKIRTSFHGTEDAVNYGKTLKGNKEAIDYLKAEYKNCLNAFEELNAIVETSDTAGMNALVKLATSGQLMRECFQEAEGKV